MSCHLVIWILRGALNALLSVYLSPLDRYTRQHSTNSTSWRSDVTSSWTWASNVWILAGHPGYTRAHHDEEAVGGSTTHAYDATESGALVTQPRTCDGRRPMNRSPVITVARKYDPKNEQFWKRIELPSDADDSSCVSDRSFEQTGT